MGYGSPLTITLKCKHCKGTGEVPNEQFEICKGLKSDELKRHFRIHVHAEDLEDGTQDDLREAVCDEPPTQPCPQCNGEGVLTFDEDAWELVVSGDEEGEE